MHAPALRQEGSQATAPGSSPDKEASQCGASLSVPALPEIQAKEECCHATTTSPRDRWLSPQDPFIPGYGSTRLVAEMPCQCKKPGAPCHTMVIVGTNSKVDERSPFGSGDEHPTVKTR